MGERDAFWGKLTMSAHGRISLKQENTLSELWPQLVGGTGLCLPGKNNKVASPFLRAAGWPLRPGLGPGPGF